MTLVHALLGALLACGAILVVQWWRTDTAADHSSRHWPGPLHLLIGFATNFFDTLGIGSFAPTTAVFRLWRLVDDERIPGTMIVGHALPVLTQALFFISVVEVDPWQMTALIVACVAGGWIGAGVVASLSRRAVQLAMGAALLVAALLTISSIIGLIPSGGTARAFAPAAFAAAIAASLLFGALLTIGIGNYAPSLIVFSLLGVDPRAAFPIMMGSGAFVATVAGVRFVRAGRLDRRAALGLTLGGVPGVLVAAIVVQSMSLDALRWLVLIVVDLRRGDAAEGRAEGGYASVSRAAGADVLIRPPREHGSDAYLAGRVCLSCAFAEPDRRTFCRRHRSRQPLSHRQPAGYRRDGRGL